MTSSIFVTSTHRGSGKTTLALGLVSILERTLGRVAYFKPVGHAPPEGESADARLLRDALGLDFEVSAMAPLSTAELAGALTDGSYDEVFGRVIEAYQDIVARSDFVVVEGTDYEGAMASFEFDVNADLSKNLDAPTLLVADALNCFETTRSGKARDPQALQRMLKYVRLVAEGLQEKNCELFGVVINRATPSAAAEIQAAVAEGLRELGIRILGTVPRADALVKPTIAEVAGAVGGSVLSGEERLDVVAQDVFVAAMNLEHVLERLTRGALVITPGDRDDLLVGLAAAYQSPAVPTPSGIVLTGGFTPSDKTMQLLRDITGGKMPVLSVLPNTYETAVLVSRVEPRIDASQRTRLEVVKGLVERHVDVEPILARAAHGSRRSGVTPKQFVHRIVDRARRDRKHIVLPEGAEERVLRAAEALLARSVADLTLLGDEATVRKRIEALGLALDGVHVVDPVTSEWRESFAEEYRRLRAHKSPTREQALDVIADPSYFGTMMVQMGRADGMVSGSINTTAATLRPALELVRTAEGFSIASSVFFMCLPDAVLVYGDCAVNPRLTAEQLADIALASAATAQAFGITPRVAMLSYSTGDSGAGSDVDRVRAATALVRERAPELPVEGPIQYDAAIDPGVARTKLPDSRVAGKATVFIFPDLNTGNNTYKAVQRAAKAVAIGPVMQGLRKPVNDLSRGCTITDIIHTVAITAVQAQT